MSFSAICPLNDFDLNKVGAFIQNFGKSNLDSKIYSYFFKGISITDGLKIRLITDEEKKELKTLQETILSFQIEVTFRTLSLQLKNFMIMNLMSN